MANFKKIAGGQYPLVAVLDVLATDTMDNIAATPVNLAFGAEDAALTTFDIVTPPPGSTITHIRVSVPTVWAGATAATLDLGDSADPDRYTETAPYDLMNVDEAITVIDFLGDGYVYDGAIALRATFLNTVTASTSGRVIIAAFMVTPGKINENFKTT